MPFCPNCGTSVQGRFCPNCGTAVDAAAASSTGAGAGPAVEPGLPANVAGALCYLPFVGFFLAILFLVIAPYNQNKSVRFNAFQSLFYHVALAAIWIAFTIVASVFATVPFIGWVVSVLLWGALSIAVLVCWLFLMWRAYNNDPWVLPVIGPMAQKQA